MLIRFKKNKTSPLRLGILKIARKKTEYNGERNGSELAAKCWLKNKTGSVLEIGRRNRALCVLSSLPFPATAGHNIKTLHELLTEGIASDAKAVFRKVGEIYGASLRDASVRSGTPYEHYLNTIRSWHQKVTEFHWKKMRLPKRDTDRFKMDAKNNWINPFSCLRSKDCWEPDRKISLAWNWQHGYFNTRNVLVNTDPFESGCNGAPFCFINLEKVSESSALLDLCWISLWALQADAERSKDSNSVQTWNNLPAIFVNRTLGQLSGLIDDKAKASGVFQLGLDCAGETFSGMKATSPFSDSVMLHEMAAITLAAAALAKCYYEQRDLKRAKIDPKVRLENWRRAKCFFGISSLSLQTFLKASSRRTTRTPV
jgi:hypothetical protein